MILGLKTLEAIREGKIDLAFRCWSKPTVKGGGTLRTAAGVLAITEVTPIPMSEIQESEARRAGYQSLDDLLGRLEKKAGTVYRIGLAFAGDDPRVMLRSKARMGAAEWDELAGRLLRLDQAREGPWTQGVLTMIKDRPAVLAAELAASLGWETLPFKRRVRQLKELGLTESLEIGYRLSPRGKVVLKRLGQRDT